jgi:hypothetical protein
MYMTKDSPTLGERAKGLVMSQLHTKIDELTEAGIDVHGTNETISEVVTA